MGAKARRGGRGRGRGRGGGSTRRGLGVRKAAAGGTSTRQTSVKDWLESQGGRDTTAREGNLQEKKGAGVGGPEARKSSRGTRVGPGGDGAAVTPMTPMKSFHSPRKEEEQRRQLESEFIQTFRRRHSLRQKLVDVEKQIYDLERHYHTEFNTRVGNGMEGYSFDFLAETVAESKEKEASKDAKTEAEAAGASAASKDGEAGDKTKTASRPGEAAEYVFLFSKSSTSSPLMAAPQPAPGSVPQEAK
ncbi:hypothetical protein HOP50_18g82830 [Chloropicon primus]|nr:hypothetical protein HOP50_18g82830 [Chloropicon primus]